MAGRRTDAQARETRAAILRRAVDVASLDGFEGLTIGRLAADLDLSKAGVLGHFGTKEALQLAAFGEAAARFRSAVVDPGDGQHGLARLAGYCARWADFVTSPPWPGGCVITAASFEYDDRPGPMGDTIRRSAMWWRRRIREAAAEAVAAAELPAGTDPDQVAFTIAALATGTVRARQTHRDPEASRRLRLAYEALLGVSLDDVVAAAGA